MDGKLIRRTNRKPEETECRLKAEQARELVSRLQRDGHCACWAGGVVRDLLLKRLYPDIDIATSATPEQVAGLFPQAHFVGQSFGVARVPFGGFEYEVSTFRQDGIYLDGRHPEKVTYTTDPMLDARRRDFTANALFYDPVTETIFDFVGGQEDIEKRLIRAVGDPGQRFQEDYLRLLRAIRFAAALDFQIEQRTWEALCRQAPGISRISPERIRDELLNMLVRPGAGNAFRLLKDSGLLHLLLPEVEEMEGVPQPPEFHPEGDVFEHTLLLLDHLENPSPELALAALFHDIGKPATIEFSDRIRFNGHDRLGAEIFERIAHRLRLSNRETEHVGALINQHMRIGQVKKMRPSTLKRLLRSDIFPDLLELHRLDCLASHRDLELFNYCSEQLEEIGEEELKPPKLLTGNDLIALGLKPGVQFGRILSEIEDLQLEGSLSTKDEALAHVRETYLSCPSGEPGGV